MVGSVGKAEQGTGHLANSAIVIVHIGQRLVEVVVLWEGRLRAEHRRLVVDEAFQVYVQRLRDLIERLNIDGDRAVFVLGQRRLTLVDHCGKLLNGITAALSVFFDALAHKV